MALSCALDMIGPPSSSISLLRVLCVAACSVRYGNLFLQISLLKHASHVHLLVFPSWMLAVVQGMQETDQEVSCEAEHLQLVGSSDEGAPDEPWGRRLGLGADLR